MPRYFFDFEVNGQAAPDYEGLELRTDRDACKEAADTLAMMVAEQVQETGDQLEAAVVVRDQLRQLIFEAAMSYTSTVTRPPTNEAQPKNASGLASRRSH